MVFFLYNAVMSDNLEFFLEHELRNNLQDIENAQLDSRLFRRKNIVDLTFEFCEKLCFNAHTRYLALEIFDRFMPKFLIESREKCKDTNQSWDDILAVIERQVPMRLLSCIQLASKYFENDRRLKPEQIVSILSSETEKYGYVSTSDPLSMAKRAWSGMNFTNALS